MQQSHKQMKTLFETEIKNKLFQSIHLFKNKKRTYPDFRNDVITIIQSNDELGSSLTSSGPTPQITSNQSMKESTNASSNPITQQAVKPIKSAPNETTQPKTDPKPQPKTVDPPKPEVKAEPKPQPKNEIKAANNIPMTISQVKTLKEDPQQPQETIKVKKEEPKP